MEPGFGPSYTQNVTFLSSLTYDCTQVTPNSAFLSTTVRATFAPSESTGMGRPSLEVRCTMYRGTGGSVRFNWELRSTGVCGPGQRGTSGGDPYFRTGGSPSAAAQRAASRRELTPSLARIAETWCPTVFSEMCR